MLKKLLLAALTSFLILFSPIGDSQEQVTKNIPTDLRVNCTDVKTALDKIHKEYREDIVFISDYDVDEHTQVAVFWNKRTRTFSVLEIMPVQISKDKKQQLACFVGWGTVNLDMRIFMDRLL